MQDNEKLRAKPRLRSPGFRHPVHGGLIPQADIVEIEADERAFYMFLYSHKGEPLGDHWFASLEEAFTHAENDFGIQKQDWETLPNPAA